MFVSLSASLMDYAEYIEAQSIKLTQAEQVKRREQADHSQTNIPLEYAGISVHIPHGNDTNNVDNTLASSNLEPLVILYQANQPVDP